MINANELRLCLGNWVEANSPPMIVGSINEFDIDLYMPDSEADCFSFDISRINGIPLTPEILEKAGFVIPAGNHSYTVVEDGVIKYKFEMGFYHTFIIGNTVFSHIKYVHQLQNLYFDLTGEELEINL